VLTGALVTLGNLSTGLEHVVTMDANGNFAFVSFALGQGRAFRVGTRFMWAQERR